MCNFPLELSLNVEINSLFFSCLLRSGSGVSSLAFRAEGDSERMLWQIWRHSNCGTKTTETEGKTESLSLIRMKVEFGTCSCLKLVRWKNKQNCVFVRVPWIVWRRVRYVSLKSVRRERSSCFIFPKPALGKSSSTCPPSSRTGTALWSSADRTNRSWKTVHLSWRGKRHIQTN